VIKLTFCSCARPISRARRSSATGWSATDRFVRSVAPALRIKRYVQSHTLTTPIDGGLRRARAPRRVTNGVAELWWDSLDD